ncbi:MAG: NAD(P)H-hydrate dehydratase [Thermodesulfovibrionales bacterium]|nr:NAD(P)H-hydrate dehydratase [Thermodesulfovibrionales bacterium]
MKIVTSEEMHLIDKKTIQEYGISALNLMERAGRAVALRIKEFFKKGNVMVIAGPGNNGGDGLVAARYLKKSGFNVKVCLLFDKDKLSPEAKIQLERLKKAKIPFKVSRDLNKDDLRKVIIVDALFGTGLKREISGDLAQLVDKINSSGNPVVAVDIPSGISSDDGSVMGKAIRADLTVTFGLPKRGHILFPGAEYTGKLYVENIGFPEELLNAPFIKTELLTEDYIRALIPQRKRYSHKGTYGHVLIIAGSKGKTGACLMAARAALRSGAGLVTMGVPETLLSVFQSRVSDEMCLGLPDSGDGILRKEALKVISDFSEKKAQVIAIGPGMGVTEDTKEIMKGLLHSMNIPLVIDADGINCLEGLTFLLKNKKQCVITPHPGEFSRLTGISREEIEKRRIELSSEFSLKYGVTTVLKGVPTVISHEGYSYINTTGNPGMAKAGSGDVLTGIIAGLMAQGLSPLNASILGVYMHGLAGDIGSKEKGLWSLLASDIIEYIPGAFKELTCE